MDDLVDESSTIMHVEEEDIEMGLVSSLPIVHLREGDLVMYNWQENEVTSHPFKFCPFCGVKL